MLLIILMALLFTLLFGLCSRAYACTGFVAGKKATADGSLISGRNEDISAAYNKVINVNPATKGEGTVWVEDPVNGYRAEVPASGCRWTMVNDVPEHGMGLYGEACMNDWGVSLTATVSTRVNETVMQFDPLLENGLREAYVPSVVIPFAHTAREGVEILGKAIETYGSAQGNTVFFADRDEIWVMEIVAGHQWAAQRVPDDCYAVVPNCIMLGDLDLDDKANFLASPGIFSMPQENGFLKLHNGRPHVGLTYGPELSPGNRVRAWGGQGLLSPSQKVAYETEVFEMFLRPDEPIDIATAMRVMAYRYEDTVRDANKNRVTAIGSERTCESHLFHYRPGKELVQWESLGNPEHGVFLPIYADITRTPEAFRVEGKEYCDKSAYWALRGLSALAEVDRRNIGTGVRAAWDLYQQELFSQVEAADTELAGLEGDARAEYENEFFERVGGEMMRRALLMRNEVLYYLARNLSMQIEPMAPFASSLVPKPEESAPVPAAPGMPMRPMMPKEKIRHHIIVKFVPEVVDKAALILEIRQLYAAAEQIEGVDEVWFKENCIDRENRYDLMIVLKMDKEALPNWDASDIYHRWKSEYGHLVAKKAIFDCE